MKDNKIRVRATNKSEVVCDHWMPVTSMELDGKKVTGIHICVDLESHDDCLNLIKFLQIHAHCFSFNPAKQINHEPTNI